MHPSTAKLRAPWRRAGISGVLLLAHLVACFAWPFPVTAYFKPGDSRGDYPCASRSCGCLTDDECWAGDCCCFTLQEKVAWANRQQLMVPEHVLDQIENAPNASCCSGKNHDCCEADAGDCCSSHDSEKAPVHSKWMIGFFVQKCKGAKFGFGFVEPIRPFDTGALPVFSLDQVGHLIPVSEFPDLITHLLDSPPPNPV